jgi:aspartate aminotransferase
MMNLTVSPDVPTYAVPDQNLIPVAGYLKTQLPTPPSKMFLINKSLKVYQQKYPGSPVFDASQGDGGASLPGVPRQILERAAVLQVEHGSAYDMPYGTDEFRRVVAEQYWQLNPVSGLGPANVIATVGGRDALVKAYQAMLALGYGRVGDVLVVSRVPWISYNWGPYGVGANVLYAPGYPQTAWAYSKDGIRASVEYAAKGGRKVAGLVITSPDNPTGNTLLVAEQADLAKSALEAGVAFVLFDWMYHYVTDERPMDLNAFLEYFDVSERPRLMFLDGITKSLGGSNIRNCHLIASPEVVKYIVSRASHEVIPSFFSQAVAIAAYEMGYREASRGIVDPTNASRIELRTFLEKNNMTYPGKGLLCVHQSPRLVARSWLARL